jgi:blue copper oxidase
MIKKCLQLVFIIMFSKNIQAQYNDMSMPQALYGTTFDLNVHESTKQLVTGNQTITGAINNENFWGPTLFINKGDLVHMNVTNNLNESTTLHWHGMHLPAVMDGGPHQVIPVITLWQPYWTVMNQASTLW